MYNLLKITAMLVISSAYCLLIYFLGRMELEAQIYVSIAYALTMVFMVYVD